MKPKVFVAREVFDDTLAFLHEHCEITTNQADVRYSAPEQVAPNRSPRTNSAGQLPPCLGSGGIE